jgi:hypothetical protein
VTEVDALWPPGGSGRVERRGAGVLIEVRKIAPGLGAAASAPARTGIARLAHVAERGGVGYRPINVEQRRRWPEVRRGAADREGTPLAQVFRARQGRGGLHATVQPRAVAGLAIGAHEYEAHHVFDIWYRNTSDIVPAAITGDMHSVNKANFAILHWFGLRFEPRFTDLDEQLKELYCADDPAQYAKCLIGPVGQIDRQAIVDEKVNIDQIVATLGLKEITQGTLIRKLCTLLRQTRRGGRSSSSTS